MGGGDGILCDVRCAARSFCIDCVGSIGLLRPYLLWVCSSSGGGALDGAGRLVWWMRMAKCLDFVGSGQLVQMMVL